MAIKKMRLFCGAFLPLYGYADENDTWDDRSGKGWLKPTFEIREAIDIINQRNDDIDDSNEPIKSWSYDERAGKITLLFDNGSEEIVSGVEIEVDGETVRLYDVGKGYHWRRIEE